MGLGEAGRPHHRAEIREQGRQRLAQAALHLRHGDGVIEGCQLVFQMGQVLRHLFAEDVGPGGQELSQLDRRGTQLFEGPGQAFPRPAPSGLRTGHQPQETGRASQGGRKQGCEFPRHQSIVSCQQPAGGQKPPDGAQSAAHALPSSTGRLRVPTHDAAPRRLRTGWCSPPGGTPPR